MKLLFDQNLSRKLVTRLADIFPNASHVQFHGLAEKTDTLKHLIAGFSDLVVIAGDEPLENDWARWLLFKIKEDFEHRQTVQIDGSLSIWQNIGVKLKPKENQKHIEPERFAAERARI